MSWTQQDTSFKKLQSKRITTSTGKGINEEKGASTLELYLPDIKTELIPGTPPGASTSVLAYTGGIGQTLAVDTSVPSNLTWFATTGFGNTTVANDGTQSSEEARLMSWISDKYDAFGTISGAGYEVKLYDKNSNLITKTDPSDWLFDYQTGILTFNNASTAYGTVATSGPYRIVGYRYIGSKGIISASYGGLGYTTYTKGDLLVGAGSTFIKLNVGSNNYILTADSSTPSGLNWVVNSGSGAGVSVINGLSATTQFFAVGSSGNEFNISSSGSTHTFNIPIAGTGTTGLITNLAQTIAGSKTFTSAILGDLTGTATTATYAYQSGYAITSGLATTSTYAYQSGYAVTSGFATTAGLATTSTYSYQSGFAVTSGFATTASYAYQSGYAITAGIATSSYSSFINTSSANLSHPLLFTPIAGSSSGAGLSLNTVLNYNPSSNILFTSGLAVTATTASTSSSNGALQVTGGVGIGGSLYVSSATAISGVTINNGVITGNLTGTATTATTSGFASTASYAYQSGYAITSGLATTANYAHESGYAITSGSSAFATTATYAYQSGYAVTSGLATTSSNANVVNSTANVNHSLLFTPSSGTISGAALSSNSTVSYNPSTFILSTPGLAVTSSAASTSFSTGALVVTGGVGIGGSLFVNGDLTINGTTTTINSVTLTVDDKNIELGSVSSPSDATAEAGGITLKGTTDKFVNWYTGTGWSSNQDWNLASGLVYKINNTAVLSASSLGTGVTNSSLTAVGTITTGIWAGSLITALYGGTGFSSYTKGDILVGSGSTFIKLNVGSDNFVLTASSSSATGLTWSPTAATGLTTLNGLSVGIQYLAFGYTGTVPAFSSSGSTHTLNIPLAGSGSTGLISTQSQTIAGQKTFTSAIIGDLTGTATTASYANQSGYAITSGLATTSTYSHQSGYAITSGLATTATYAHQSGFAITAGLATTATYSYQSGYGITAGLATTANYAYQSGYGITSGFATTAANINILNVSTGTFYPILSNIFSTASGVGASVSGLFSFNASSGAFGATSIGIFAGQSYSIGGNSVLSATSLGTGVTNSSLTALGTITTGTWAGSLITALYGATGYSSYTKGDILVGSGNTFIKLNVGSDNFVLTADNTTASGVKWTSVAGLSITSVNGLTASAQFFSTGTSGSGFNISSSGSTHTFNIPIAGTGATGLVSTLAQSFAGTKTFTGDVIVSSTTGSTAFNTGSLTVYGGLGVSGQLSFNQAALGYTGATNPSIAFIGSTTSAPITLTVLSDSSLLWEGTSGKLFGINNNLSSGWIFNVGDISGLPIIRANADGTIAMAEFTANVGIGLSNPSYKLHVSGDTNLSSSYVYRINGTSVLSASSLGTGVTNSSLTAVGTITTGTWAATAITALYGGTGLVPSFTVGDILYANTSSTWERLAANSNSGYVLSSAGSGATPTYIAPSALSVGFATTAGFATTSSYAYQSGYAITSGLATTATYSHQSGYAITSGLATTASYAHQSGYAITSGFATTAGLATTATYAHQSGYAITSGFATSSTSASIATTSTNINVVSATTSASHPVLFTPATGTASGAAVSTESSFVYNPSTDILSVSGLAVTSGTASTNATTGALVVTGGVGIGGSLFVGGDLTINGTTTTINSVTLTVDDKNIELGSVSSPSDVTAEGGGITLKGATDKFLNWYSGTGWSSSESFNLASGNAYKINNTTVLSASSLGTGVTNSSLTALGTITTGVWAGTAITGLYGGTGYTTYSKGDLLVGAGSTFIKLAVGTDNFVLTASSFSAIGLSWLPTAATGITSLNGLSSSVQYFSIGYSGTAPAFSSSGSTHTLNIPIAGTGVTGLITGIAQTIAGQKTFTSAIIGDLTGTATTAGFATTANYSHQSGFATSSGLATTATYAHQSGYAITAGLATTASYAYQSGYAITSGLATTATYAYQSGYAITSGFATTSANINVVNAVTNSAHPLHFSPVATGSGVAVSSNTAFSFNPSTLILSTSGLAVTASTASTSSSTGAFVVNGGVGIGGSVYTATDLNVGNSTTGRLYFSQATLGSAGTTVIPSMAFIGATNSPITLSVLADNSLSFDGSSGQLFSINNNLSTGYIFAVNDISGLPLLRANADGTVTMGEFAGNIGIGLSNPSYKLHVAGDTNLSSGYVYRINGTSVLSASSLGTGVTNSSLTSVGIINLGTWAGSTITALYGGTGYSSYTKGDILVGSGTSFIKLGVGTDNYILSASSSSATGLTWVANTGGGGAGTVYNGSLNAIPYYPAAGTAITGSINFTNTGTGISIAYSTASINTVTGAFTVSGGVGIGGSLYTSSSYADSISGVVINNGVITTGSWAGSIITGVYGGTGYSTYTKGDILVGAGSTFIKVGSGSTNYVLSSSSIYPAGVGWTWVSAVEVGTNPPVNEHDSDLWWNSNDGSLNFYYNDGDTSQWVEIAGGSGIDLSQPVYITSSTASTNTVTGALIVDGGVGVGGTVYASSFSINGVYDQISSTLTTSNTNSNQVALSIDASSFRTAKMFVQVTSGSNYHSQEILMVHDNSQVYMTEYAMVNTGAIGSTFDGDISGGNMRFLVTPTNAVTTYKIACSAMRI
jgi:hypothetical protein